MRKMQSKEATGKQATTDNNNRDNDKPQHNNNNNNIDLLNQFTKYERATKLEIR